MDRVSAVLQRYFDEKTRNPKATSEQISQVVGVPASTLREWVRRYAEQLNPLDDVVVTPPPEPGESIEDILARKKARMAAARRYDDWAQLIPVAVHTDQPIGLTLVGDPHIDDDHCDVAALERDLAAVKRTPGMYAGHVGDLTNNWVGRLAKLYANQSSTFEEGLRLTEWMLESCPTLFLVAGNHDCWNNGMDILRFVVKQAGVGATRAHGARMALTWPNGRSIRIHARHDFPGKSQFSDTHGMKRELLFGHKDHILVAGHTHVDEARAEPSVDGTVHWMFRVSGYKVIDDFAHEHNFRAKRMAPSVSVVLDPSQPVPAEQVKPFWCVEAAGDYLTFLRKRRK